MPPTPGPQHAFSRFSTAASVVLIAVGGLVLLGWTFDLAALKGFAAGITMKPNAAVGLLASGLALFSIAGPRPSLTAARVFALVPLLIGVATLIEHLAGSDLGIDQILFSEEPGAAGTASPGRMGPNGSLNLTLAGIALWCLTRADLRAHVVAQWLAACMAALALVPTVGYLYGAHELYAVARYTGIALHTGLSILILSAGILAARRRVGPVSALTSDAAHGVMARRLLVPATLIPLLLGYVRLIGERRGWFDAGLGVAIFVVAVIILLSLTIWHTAAALARSDVARQTAETALTETQQEFRWMADQAPILIWVEDAAAGPWFNRRWYTFTGAPPGSRDWEAVVHPDDVAELRAVRESAVRESATYAHQYRLRRADGRLAWVLETGSPRVPTRRGAGYIGSCIDITDLRLVQQEREELLALERAAREKAERADRAKDEFIAALSHELRTPLNAILGWIHMLQRDQLEASGRSKATEAVARNAGVLARLIEDLLDTSRITTGQLAVSRSRVDMKSVVQAAIESVMPDAERRGVGIVISADGAAPVIGDPQRLQQVVWNLLSNAVKFSSPGRRVEVRLSTAPDGVTVRVCDEGEGIDPSFLPYVFERFRQADASTTKTQSGLGLGLYIAKHLTELHGGELLAASDGRGRGAVFTIHLPSAAPPPMTV